MNTFEKINGKDNYKIDVPVLLIFFNRPKTFSKVFEQVKIAKPSKLFLYCDGPRNEKEIELVYKARNIAEDIDWNCEVYRYYQEENKGCDPSEYISQKWAFSIVDKCIVLEDDDVPSQSFFPFCKELLDKYENDERINIICGMNSLGTYDNGYDYLFSYQGSITGWASWKRVIDKWDSTFSLLDDQKFKNNFIEINDFKYNMKQYLYNVKKHKNSGREHYESILSFNMLCNNSINIVPCKNLISNIGNCNEGGTHGVIGDYLLPKSIRNIFSQKTYELSFPLKHPNFVIEDIGFRKKFFKIMRPNKLVAFSRKIESILLKIRYGRWDLLVKKIKKRGK